MKKFLFGAAAMLAVAAPLHADNGGEEGRWYINPGVVIHKFDSDRHLERGHGLFAGLEYRFDQNWGAEIRHIQSDSEIDNMNIDVDLTQTYLDGLYYLDRDGKFEPFIVGGIGHGDFDTQTGAERKDTLMNLGLGARYWFTDNVSARASARGVRSWDERALDGMFSFGVSYAFGASGRKVAPIAPADSDGDGVIDAEDQCPGTPKGVKVNTRGCPLDSDRDGVVDYKDECPDTPRGREVDAKGCKFVLKRTEEISLEVNFANNSAEVTEQYMDEIKLVADFMKKYAGVNAEIEGHTDSNAAASYNKNLSQRRADAVKAVLVERFGIDAKRLIAKGYGEEQPIADNATAAGRKANRRVIAVMKAEISE